MNYLDSVSSWDDVVDNKLIPWGLDGKGGEISLEVSPATVANALSAIRRFRQKDWSAPDEALVMLNGAIRFVWRGEGPTIITATITASGKARLRSARNGMAKWTAQI